MSLLLSPGSFINMFHFLCVCSVGMYVSLIACLVFM